MIIRIDRKKYFEIVVLCGYLLALVLNIYGLMSGANLLLATIVANVIFIHKFWRNQSIIVCLSFTLTYWLYMVLYYFGGYAYCTYTRYQTLEYTDVTLRIAGLFMVLLFTLIQPFEGLLVDRIPQKKNSLVFIGSVAVMLFVCVYAFQIGDIFAHKISGDVNSPLYEYYFIFALLAYVYAGNKRNQKLLLCINMLYSIVLLRLGLRLVVLMIILMLFLQYFEGKFKTKWVIVCVLAGFMFMSFWSVLRSGLTTGSFDLVALLGIKGKTLMTNQGDVFYTSTVQVAQLLEGNWDTEFRWSSLISFIYNIFLFSDGQYVDAKLNTVLSHMGFHVPGGGFGAMSAFVWLGWIGVIILAVYVSYFINAIFKDKKGEMHKIYGVFLIFTFFRWYAYNLSIVFKMGFWLFGIYTVVKIIHKTFGRRKA